MMCIHLRELTIFFCRLESFQPPIQGDSDGTMSQVSISSQSVDIQAVDEASSIGEEIVQYGVYLGFLT